MTSPAWEASFLGTPPHPHHGGGGGWYGGPGNWGPGFYEEPMMLPIVSSCPPGTVLDSTGYICNPVATQKSGLGQFNPVQVLTQMATGQSSSDLQRNVQNISKDVEMYAYAQLGLQTVAAAATFGFFLITLYTFLKKRKAGTL